MATSPSSTPPNQYNLFLYAWSLFQLWLNRGLPSQVKQVASLRNRTPH